MPRSSVLIVSTILVLTCAVSVQAAGPVIGLAVSSGRIEVDRAPVDSNANLIEGSVVRAANAPARLEMTNGARLTLSTSSVAKVFADRVVLESGIILLNQHPMLPVQADGFLVRATGPSAQALVERRSAKEIEVSAVRSGVQVLDPQGVLLARVMPGKPLTFEPSTDGAAPASQVRGKLLQEDGKFVLQDDLTHLQVELRGDNLGRFVNHRVEASGLAERGTGKEAQRILVSRLNLADDTPSEPDKTGQSAPSKGSTATKAATGLSHGAKIGIGLGIAAGVGLGAGIPLATISR